MGSPDPRDLARWSDSLAAIARTGLGFSDNLYERERFEEGLHIAADIRAAATELDDEMATHRETDHFVQEWLANIGEGVPGYITPKVAIGAVVGNDDGQLLLVQRRDSGIWLYPTGWADVGYSPSEVAVKEVAEVTAGEEWWGPLAFAAVRGEPVDVRFEVPRDPVWRSGPDIAP